MKAPCWAGIGLIALSGCGLQTGCAWQNPAIRQLPPDTPAADNAEAIRNAEAQAAAARQAADAAPQPAPAAVTPLTPADAPSMLTYDPWGRMNRAIYRFNARFDEAIFLPVADSYGRLPSPLRTGVHNFFLNLSEPKSAANYLLQLRPVATLRSVARFVINSTVGIGGLIDVARHVRLDSQLTGFSITLARWGMHPGPYLVLPLLGPSTLRDGIGELADYGISYAINLADLYRGYQSWALGTLDAVDQRASNDFRYYSSGSPFEYETIRFLYVHRELIEDEALHARRKPQVPDRNAPAGR
jgi:phospholipid-binding lipoprotein MlaA